MAESRTSETLQRLGISEKQIFRQRLAGLGRCKLLRSIGLDPDKLAAIVMYDEKRNIVCRGNRG
ncbi:MAG TPA: hypothetical protein VF353_05015 [Candidatus Binatia bacterium]